MSNNPQIEELTRRVAALETALARITLERDREQKHVYAELEADDPFVPPTPEEIHQMLNGPYGQPVEEILDEFLKQRGAS